MRQTRLYRVLIDVVLVLDKAVFGKYLHLRKALLPDFPLVSEFLLRAIGKIPFIIWTAFSMLISAPTVNKTWT